MSQQDNTEQGIPTRAIHEAYLNLQQTHRSYRQARDAGQDAHSEKAAFQDAVLTFYELVRPHLKHETALEDYWQGNLPDYTGWNFDTEREAVAYIQDHGTGVYQVQRHTDAVTIEQRTLTDGGPQTFADWHELLGLSWDSERLVAVDPREEACFVKLLRCAVLPLRELDHWQATIVRERDRGDGFMAGETSVETRREFQPPQKLVTAKRLLVEAADRLGALSEFEASTQTTEITREDMQKVEEWRQKQLE